MCKVDLDAEGEFETSELMKLGGIIAGQADNAVMVRHQEFDDGISDDLRCAILQFSDRGESGFPFDQDHEAVFASTRSHDGVRLPVKSSSPSAD